MTDVTCAACGASNDSAARFCASCGTGLPALGTTAPAAADGGPAVAAPSGWDLAAAGMAQQPVAAQPGLDKDDYASWGARLGAVLLDGLILSVVLLIVGAGVAGVWHLVDPAGLSDSFDGLVADLERGGSSFEDSDGYTWFGAWFVFSAAAGLLWEALWLRSSFMGKPGQRALGFRVTDAAGARLTTGRSFGRAFAKLPYSIPNLNWLSLITSAIMIGANKRRRALHDVIAGTVCIEDAEWKRITGAGPVSPVLHPATSRPGAAPAAPPSAPYAPAPPPLPKPPGSDGPFV